LRRGWHDDEFAVPEVQSPGDAAWTGRAFAAVERRLNPEVESAARQEIVRKRGVTAER
jgi:hypothetical protein